MSPLRKLLRSNAEIIPGVIGLWSAIRSRLDPHERALRRVQALSPGLLLQPSHYTRANRYPWLFNFFKRSFS